MMGQMHNPYDWTERIPMKRILIILAAIAMFFSMTACGDSYDSEASHQRLESSWQMISNNSQDIICLQWSGTDDAGKGDMLDEFYMDLGGEADSLSVHDIKLFLDSTCSD